MDHEQHPAVDPFRRQAQIVRHRDERLAGGRDVVDVGELKARE